MQSVFEKKNQDRLLKKMAISRLTRNELAGIIGISIPTIRKLLNAPTPVVINRKTFTAVEKWLSKVK